VDQLATALQVHHVTRDEFERQVESDNPPTITELARQGTKSRPEPLDMLEGRDPADFQAATGVLGLLGYATEKISHLDIEGAILGMDARETSRARRTIGAIVAG
jgi:hypothetical protein